MKPILLLMTALNVWLVAAPIDRPVTAAAAMQELDRASQARINKLDDESAALYAQYRTVLQEQERIRGYNTQVTRMIASQEKELASLQAQIDTVADTEQALIPLMQRMIDTLGEFVEADMPFLADLRRKDVEVLRTMMDDASVGTGEKFRKILETYLTELEYARTIEAYRDTLPRSPVKRTVDLLRIGRTALYYRTLDGSEAGMWHPQKHAWVVLDGDADAAIKRALMIARKHAAPDLLTLPVVKER